MLKVFKSVYYPSVKILPDNSSIATNYKNKIGVSVNVKIYK